MKELNYEDDGDFDWILKKQAVEDKIKREEEIQKNMLALKNIQTTSASNKGLGLNQKLLA